MQLGSPSSLMWLLLAIPIVIFYMLKVRPRRVPVPSVILWEQVFHERKPRAIWQRLRHLVSLLLQLLFLLLVVAALSNPFFAWQLEQSRTIVVVIDNSASMSSTDIAGSRLESAKDAALKLINGLREHEKMAIISAAEPEVEIGFNDHPRWLSRSVEQIRATDSPARLSDAITLAERLVEGKNNGQIIVLSDQNSAADPSGNEDRLVRFVTIGSRADNVAITQFHVRRSLNDRVAFQVLISVVNFGDVPANIQLELQLGEQLLDVLPLELEANEPWQAVLEYSSVDGGTITATIDHEDALASDNRAFAELTPRLPQPVILVSPGSFFLENVLASIPQVELSIQAEVPAKVPDDTILVVHRTQLTQVPERMVFCINPISDSDLWNLGPVISDPVVSQQAEESPLMHHLRLENVVFPAARKLTIAEPNQVLAQTLDGSAVYVAMVGATDRRLVLSADLERGDLPLRTAFPILMNNAISWFQGQSGELQPALSTGQITQVSIESAPLRRRPNAPAIADSQPLELVAPDGRRRPVIATHGVVTVGPLDQCGIWQLQSAGADQTQFTIRQIACNLANASESDVRVEQPSEALIESGVWMSRPAWIYLVLLALALIGAEWFLYQRRWIS